MSRPALAPAASSASLGALAEPADHEPGGAPPTAITAATGARRRDHGNVVPTARIRAARDERRRQRAAATG